MQLGFRLWSILHFELRVWSAYCSAAQSLFPHQVPSWYMYLLRHIVLPFEEKFLGNDSVRFLVCSTFSRLINQTVLEFRVNWMALHYFFRLQKLVFPIHTPILWHSNRRIWGSLRDPVSILVAWSVYQVGVGGVWTDAFACDEALASCCCQFCVPANCYYVTLFQCRGQSTEVPLKEFYSIDDPLSVGRRLCNLLLWALKRWLFCRNKLYIWCTLA